MRKFTLLVVLLGSLSFTSYLNAQPGGDPTDGNPTDVPITGIEILLALGGLFGVKKIIGERRKK